MTDLAGYQITPHLRLNDGELEQRWDNHSGDDRPASVWVAVPNSSEGPASEGDAFA